MITLTRIGLNIIRAIFLGWLDLLSCLPLQWGSMPIPYGCNPSPGNKFETLHIYKPIKILLGLALFKNRCFGLLYVSVCVNCLVYLDVHF